MATSSSILTWEIPWTEESMESQSQPQLSTYMLCNLDTFFKDSPKTLFLSFSRKFSCVPFVKRMAPVDGTLLSRGYLLRGFSLPITFSRVQKFDSNSSMNTGNFKKDDLDDHVYISLAFQLLDIDQIFRFHI